MHNALSNAVAATDADGTEIYWIKTANGRPFKIAAATIDRLGPGPFYWNADGRGREYVRCMGHDNNLGVRRLITQAGLKQTVKTRDGDPANLREDNLIVVMGGAAKHCDSHFRRDRDPPMLAGEPAESALAAAGL